MDAHEEGLLHDLIKVCVEERVPGYAILRWRDYNNGYNLEPRNRVLRRLRDIGRSAPEVELLTGMTARQINRIFKNPLHNKGGTQHEHTTSS